MSERDVKDERLKTTMEFLNAPGLLRAVLAGVRTGYISNNYSEFENSLTFFKKVKRRFV